MYLKLQYLSDSLSYNMPNMLQRFEKQLGPDTIDQYKEAEQEYSELAEKMKQSNISFDMKEDISDIEFCIYHRFLIQNVLCYLQGVQDGQKSK